MAIIRYLSVLLFTFIFSGILAQTEKVKNLPYIDQRRIHFGFVLGMHTQDLAFSHTGKIQPGGDSWYAEIPEFSIGFSVGLVSDLAFTESLNLRFTPSMYFGNKNVVLREASKGTRISQDIKSNYIMLPVHLRYSARRVNNYRPYITTGFNPMIDISKRKDTPLVLNRFDVAFEVGFGCDLYLPFFKLIPELKFSLGLADVLKHKRPDLKDPAQIIYTEGINKANSRMVSLLFYFE
ncbi:MAG: porin family protein [Bacteroidales bacterium]